MKYCSLCKVCIDTNKNFCPLCHNALLDDENKSPQTFPNFSKEKDIKKSKKTVTKIFLILSLAITIACICINVLTKTIAWSVTVALGLVYLWVLVAHTIISRDTPFKKVLFQLIAIIAFLVSTNIIFGGNAWLTNYVYPSIAMMVTVILSMVVFCSKKRKNLLFSFFCIFILMALASVAFLIFKIDTYKIINVINLVVQAFVLFAYLLFAHKIIISEASRKFHI